MEKQNRIVAGLTFISLVALVAAYFAPIWWVSLTAPNYPPDAFPDGIRIHFHFDGVYNGCKAAGTGTTHGAARSSRRTSPPTTSATTRSPTPRKDVNKGAEGLDCVHEMNTINHYVGMYPIATGAPVEKPPRQILLRLLCRHDAGFHHGQEKAAFNRVDRRLCCSCRLDDRRPVCPWQS